MITFGNGTSGSTSPAALQQAILLVGQANAQIQARNYTQAVQHFQQAVRVCPSYSVAWQGFVNMLVGLNEFENALKVIQAVPAPLYQQSLPLQERHCLVLSALKRYREAIPVLSGMLGNPAVSQSELYAQLGICHFEADNYKEALDWLEKARAAGYRSVALYRNLIPLYRMFNNIEAWQKNLEEAVQHFPQDTEFRYSQSIFLLMKKDWKNGFHLHKQRWESETFMDGLRGGGHPPLPLWDGETRMESLLILPEQGVGDEILFSTFLPALSEKVGRMTVACDARLLPLFLRTFSHSFPDIHFLAKNDSALADVSGYQAYFYAADGGALVPDVIGWKNGYLKPDMARSQTLRQKYQAMFPDKKLVGISWKSTRPGIFGESRNAELAAWLPILKNPDCQFISLQYGDVADDLRFIRETLGVHVYEDAEIDCFGDLDGLAAQMAALDLVISATNTTAHLAAATQTPTWIMTPVGPGLFWCWGLDEGTDFYPEARLFRAKAFNEWEPVVAEVALALQQH